MPIHFSPLTGMQAVAYTTAGTTTAAPTVPALIDTMATSPGTASPPGPTRSGSVIALRTNAPAFALSKSETVRASGPASTFGVNGSKGFSSNTIELTRRDDGSLFVRNAIVRELGLQTKEDVTMVADGHGGFVGKTARGEWTLSPLLADGSRELQLAPYVAKSARPSDARISRQKLYVSQPLRDLAVWHDTRLVMVSDSPGSVLPVKLDVSGDHLKISLPGNETRVLSRMTPSSAFADHEDERLATTTVDHHTATNTYEIRVKHGQRSYKHTLQAQALPTPQTQPREFLVFDDDNAPSRASVTTLADGTRLLRLAEGDPAFASALYFDAHGPGSTVTLRNDSGATKRLRLEPLALEERMSALAGKTATLTVKAPVSYDGFNQSKDMTTRSFTVRFTDVRFAAKESEARLGLSIDGVQSLVPLSAGLTELGEYCVYINGAQLWIRPLADGTFDARVCWRTNETHQGTFEIH